MMGLLANDALASNLSLENIARNFNMRLTLRTLLAYLDNTLEPRDAEALRQKIAESGFATQLVQRIRGTVSRNVLPAPSPQGVGPLDDPNVMGEFLDSTLPAEQVAEIERACLESDPLLAEAAACHQILTVILAQPAEVSEPLRQRVYDLPNRNDSDMATAGSFSSLTIPPSEEPADQAGPTRESGTTGGTAETVVPSAAANRSAVKPVGVTDSGVSDAPTRLRQAEAEQTRNREPAIAGSKPRPVDDTRIYGGSIRPSRITPWLVSLALVAVLLFALYQIFEPILDRSPNVAQQTNDQLADEETSSRSSDSADPLSGDDDASLIEDDAESQLGTNRLESPESTPEADDLIIPTDGPSVDSAGAAANDNGGDEASVADKPEIIESVGAPPPPPGVKPTDQETATPTEDPTTRIAGLDREDASETIPPKDSADVTDAAPPIPPSMESEERLPGDPAAVTEVTEETSQEMTDEKGNAEKATDESEATDEPIAVAKVASEETLLIARDDGQWKRLNRDDDVNAGQMFVIPPDFRVKITTGKTEWTFSGPAKGQWTIDETGKRTFQFDYGSLVIDPLEPDTIVSLDAGQEKLQVAFSDIDTQAAVHVEFDRQPGLDPLVPENRIASIEVYAIGGSLQLISNTDTMQVPDGQKWVRQGTAIPDLQQVESPPSWLEPAERGQPSLQALAREGLMALIQDNDSLQIALREATLFRRAEVAALAAQTLLQLGFGDVYFGGDGILSEIKQRIYWPEHYKSLKAHVNRSAESAAALRDSIAKMDSANATALFKLLTGFSQRQLVEGADQRLVAMLDSSSTAVRVLALENLREITGTTMNFRPEEDNDVRRAPGVKKWEVRQRKGDIRWQP